MCVLNARGGDDLACAHSTRTGSYADNLWTDEPPQISFHMLCDTGFGGRAPIWAAYGDLGLDVDQYRDQAPSIPALAADMQNGFKGPAFDGVIHAGDYAYDFAVDGGLVGDRFMNALQPFASKVPYMGAIGNHECGGANLQHYGQCGHMRAYQHPCTMVARRILKSSPARMLVPAHRPTQIQRC